MTKYAGIKVYNISNILKGMLNGTNGIRRFILCNKFQHGFSVLFSRLTALREQAIAMADGSGVGAWRNICQYDAFHVCIGNMGACA